jgi:peroxiredoxin
MIKLKLICVFFLVYANMQAQSDNNNFLKKGDQAPHFVGIDQNKTSVDLNNLLNKGKVVLVFYRGAWCPYCNKHMSHLQDSLKYITEKGASIVAVTPEILESIGKTVSKTNARFSIIHDSAYVVMNRYGVAFKLDDKTVKKYKLFGINLEKTNGNQNNVLPVPATFIINQNGKIDFIDFDEDYKRRLPVLEILRNL